MKLLDRWLGVDEVGAAGEGRFVSRRLTVTDVKKIGEAFGTVCSPVTFTRAGPGVVPDRPVDLDNASDADLRAIKVSGWIMENQGSTSGGLVAVSCTLGSDVMAVLEVHGADILPQHPMDRIEAAAVEASRVITNVPRYPSRSHWWQAIRGGAWVLAVALVIWFLMVTWPNVPLMLVGVVAVAGGVRALLWGRSWGIAEEHPFQVSVLPVTQAEWRERRWNSRRTWRDGAIGSLVGAVITLAIGFLPSLISWFQGLF